MVAGLRGPERLVLKGAFRLVRYSLPTLRAEFPLATIKH